MFWKECSDILSIKEYVSRIKKTFVNEFWGICSVKHWWSLKYFSNFWSVIKTWQSPTLGPFGPWGPCGPVGPLSPRSPFNPLGPRSPCFPFFPSFPENPFGPPGPRGPWGPFFPMGPCGPLGPVGPRSPVAPLGPKNKQEALFSHIYHRLFTICNGDYFAGNQFHQDCALSSSISGL